MNVAIDKPILLLVEYNCDDCWSPKHCTGSYVTCPNCRYKDETNMGTGYDYLYGGEFLDSYCRNCGVRLQATYKISKAWITHEIYPQEIENEWRHRAYLRGDYMYDYAQPN